MQLIACKFPTSAWLERSPLLRTTLWSKATEQAIANDMIVEVEVASGGKRSRRAGAGQFNHEPLVTTRAHKPPSTPNSF